MITLMSYRNRRVGRLLDGFLREFEHRGEKVAKEKGGRP